jgi:hypothetical protein
VMGMEKATGRDMIAMNPPPGSTGPGGPRGGASLANADARLKEAFANAGNTGAPEGEKK